MSRQKKPTEMQLAFGFYVQDGMPPKEISKALSVSENTLSKWVNKYGWLKKREEHLRANQAVKTIAGLRDWLVIHHTELASQIDEAIFDYLIN